MCREFCSWYVGQHDFTISQRDVEDRPLKAIHVRKINHFKHGLIRAWPLGTSQISRKKDRVITKIDHCFGDKAKIEIFIGKGKTIACGEYGNQKQEVEVKASEFRVIPNEKWRPQWWNVDPKSELVFVDAKMVWEQGSENRVVKAGENENKKFFYEG